MIRRLSSLLLAAGCAPWSIAAPAAAHEFWIAPSSHRAGPGDTIAIGARVGTGFRGESLPFSARRCVRLVARAGRTVDLAPAAIEGDPRWARFAPPDDSGVLFGYESDFTSITLPAAEFERYLAEEGLEAPLAARGRDVVQGPGRERYRRCAKAWVAGRAERRATHPLGLPLEIVPRSAPGSSARLAVRLLWEGRPLEGGLIRAWRVPGAPETRDPAGAAWEGRTDARGAASVPTADEGRWLIAAVHMVPSRDPAIADWESTWTSLTFESARPRTRRSVGNVTSSRNPSPTLPPLDRRAR